MKSILLVPVLAIMSFASPLADPGADVLSVLEKRDNKCSFYPGITEGYCRSCPSRGCSGVLKYANTARDWDFGVNCKCAGESVSGNNIWDWVPGWGCFISASITDSNCESGIGYCAASICG